MVKLRQFLSIKQNLLEYVLHKYAIVDIAIESWT